MKRIAAIDILSALTMLWMLFVNDIPALQGVPHWLFHAEATEDMLGFSDLVFPAFLFCVGMSIPFAIDSRLKRGASMGATMGHVLLSSANPEKRGTFRKFRGSYLKFSGSFLERKSHIFYIESLSTLDCLHFFISSILQMDISIISKYFNLNYYYII